MLIITLIMFCLCKVFDEKRLTDVTYQFTDKNEVIIMKKRLSKQSGFNPLCENPDLKILEYSSIFKMEREKKSEGKWIERGRELSSLSSLSSPSISLASWVAVKWPFFLYSTSTSNLSPSHSQAVSFTLLVLTQVNCLHFCQLSA